MLKGVLLITLSGMSVISCKNASESPLDSSTISSGKETSKVPVEAYNAYSLWRREFIIDISEGSSDQGIMISLSQDPLTKFPEAYNKRGLSKNDRETDNAFIVHYNMWREDGEFTRIPTKVAKVENDTLIYPANPSTLTLKFSSPSKDPLSHDEAVKFCEKMGRLPTAREIFDFCTAGVNNVDFGKEGDYANNAKKARCAGQDLWSVSIESRDYSLAWRFDSNDGDLDRKNRDTTKFLARCIEFK